MRPQLNRLAAEAGKGFGGSAIDRGKPLRFRLDGRLISGFAGDTVLSAALASGIDTLGRHGEHPLGLTLRAAPPIAYAALAADPQRALPMARTPALDGADLVTMGGSRRASLLARLFQPGRTLGLVLDDPHALDEPWRQVRGVARDGGDLVVVGGGVAGLSAALAAARAGLRVTLVEAEPHPGGRSGLFGTQEGEDSPEASMGRLTAEVAASDAITVLTGTHAFALRPGLVRVHRVDLSGATAQGQVLDLAAPRIVLATGAVERLPLFAGNRLPGVVGTADAYALATRYGIWPGRRAVLATVSSPAYRLAMLASDAGIAIDRILDSRPRPSSRFIEFAKAYGIRQFPGTVPGSAQPAKAGGTVSVHLPDRAEEEGIVTDRLVVCGGWQPDLTLWHVAGGDSVWEEVRHRLAARGTLDGIALAGSAAGYLTRRGCIQSGADAVDQLLGRERRPVDDPVIEALYETPDDPAFAAGPRPDKAPCYLDDGPDLLERPAPRRRRWRDLFGRQRRAGLPALSEAPQPLAIGHVAAGVDLGLIPAASAGIVAQERVALVPLAGPEAVPEPEDAAPAPADVPFYLAGRFGPDARVLLVVPEEERLLETGALIYPNSDGTDPLQAIGVVLRPCPGGATALLRGDIPSSGRLLTVRDHGRPVPARTAQPPG